jgi:hypothetical protein
MAVNVRKYVTKDELERLGTKLGKHFIFSVGVT